MMIGASSSLQVLVVANPANTNALILKEFAPSIPEKNISCLTRLDHNRALGQLSERLHVPVSDVKNVIIWGNHSSTQYPDVNHATIATPTGLKPARELVADDEWCLYHHMISYPYLFLSHPFSVSSMQAEWGVHQDSSAAGCSHYSGKEALQCSLCRQCCL